MTEKYLIKCKCQKSNFHECKGEVVKKMPDTLGLKLKSLGAVYSCPFAYYDSINHWDGYHCANRGEYSNKTFSLTVRIK